ncbi:hypothetical protein EZV62_027249 [Acer yangbiense]|uniref:Uncharacterized protein n=1 Tax=Acer yangbiense TaxID=1000413 RepID=A0A5C7GTQ2_9ROSI|nr:hypothetical protein EZV62_027249 [Acer yangbiense]
MDGFGSSFHHPLDLQAERDEPPSPLDLHRAMEIPVIFIADGDHTGRGLMQCGESQKCFLRNIQLDPGAFSEMLNLRFLKGIVRLTCLPNGICKLKCLEELNLIGCSKLGRLPDDLGNLKALKKLKVSGTGVREVPSSIACLINSGTLSFERCQGQELMGWQLPSLLGLYDLTNLVLSDCNIKELPESLGSLFSVKMLSLCRNNFESIPESIINLSKLILLNISYCERLKSLPILPRDLKLVAHNCTSLEAFELFTCRPSYTLVVDFINCFRLQQNALRYLVDHALNKIQFIPSALYTELDEVSHSLFYIFLGCDFVMYPENFGEYYYTNEFSVQFYIEDYYSERMHCCEVKKCGVRLISRHEFGNSILSTSSDEDYFCKYLEKINGNFVADMHMEEEIPHGPHQKSSKLSVSFKNRMQIKDELMQSSETRLLESVGGGDIRIQALRTPDHPKRGCVGGMGEQRLLSWRIQCKHLQEK